MQRIPMVLLVACMGLGWAQPQGPLPPGLGQETPWWRLALLVLTVLLYLYQTYTIAVGLQGLRGPAPLPPARHFRRFAVLIPAHNEAQVIGQLLQSLQAQRYPAGFLQVFVVADNCRDETAAVARNCGVEVLERHDLTRRGKSHAVRWALRQIPLNGFDALAMFDADNLAHPDFIARMNDYLEAHPEAEAVQGYLETKNPSDTWITRSYALSYWYLNRFWSLARAHWGLSVVLGGTGFVIRTPALSRLGWELHSLTEDLELTVRIVLQGGRIHWNDAAWVYDEKPLTLAASLRQRTRWARGQYWVLWRYAPAAVSGFLRTGRWQHLDLLVLLATPLLYAAGYLATLGGWAVALLAPPSPAPEWVSGLSAVGTTLAVLQAFLLTGLAPLLRFGRWDPGYLLMLLPYTFYVLTWAWPVFTAPFQAHDQGNWAKTPHTRALRLEELDG